MEFENRKVPEGTNYSTEHPLKEFAWLLIAFVLLAVSAIALLFVSVDYLVRLVPLETELKLGKSLQQQLGFTDPAAGPASETRNYLQNLADRLAAVQGIPAGHGLSVHYRNEPVINAYATLGGHIVIYQGLLQKLPHENALSMVLAHEIAHVVHRDPLVSAGRATLLVMALATLTGGADSGLFSDLFSQVADLTSMKFSRDQELQADQAAVGALNKLYGHSAGADALFQILADQQTDLIPEFMNTHPLTGRRLQHIRSLGGKTGTDLPLTPLPEFIRTPADALPREN